MLHFQNGAVINDFSTFDDRWRTGRKAGRCGTRKGRIIKRIGDKGRRRG
jgi:hypothetical protein